MKTKYETNEQSPTTEAKSINSTADGYVSSGQSPGESADSALQSRQSNQLTPPKSLFKETLDQFQYDEALTIALPQRRVDIRYKGTPVAQVHELPDGGVVMYILNGSGPAKGVRELESWLYSMSDSVHVLRQK